MRCPRSYYYKRVLRLPQTTSWPLVFGSALHAAAAEVARQRFAASRAQEWFQNTVARDLELLGQGERDALKWSAVKADLKEGDAIIRAYAEDAERLTVATIPGTGEPAVEWNFSADLPGMGLMVGYVDKIVDTPDGLLVCELKSSKRFNWVSVHADHQLTLYAYAVSEAFGIPISDIHLEVTKLRLLPKKPEEAHGLTTRTEVQVEAMIEDVQSVCALIKAHRWPRNLVTGPCVAWGPTYCDYFRECFGVTPEEAEA